MNLFFYGTLMHPKVLSRVIGHDHIDVKDGILDAHVRLHVHGEDYPAVTSVENARSVVARPLTADESRVRGTVALNLTQDDVAYLDEFEGDEYERVPVKVRRLDGELPVDAQVYVWKAALSRLSPELWSFDDFMREKAHRWVGKDVYREDYAEVDRRRAMKGVITPGSATPPPEQTSTENGLPTFGKGMLKDYDMDPDYININNGSYGIAPRVVKQRFWQYHQQADSRPDLYHRKQYAQQLLVVRKRLADFVHCDVDDLVVVGNATTGVNAALRSLAPVWNEGDGFLYLSTTIYNACEATLRGIIDSMPRLNLRMVPVEVKYPIAHRDLVAAVRAKIEEEQQKGHVVRLALIDAISSNPGVVVPWAELVSLFREKDIISMVDAAHEIGQLPVNLRETQPDFWVSNCHKWLMCQRGCAAFYVAKKWQHVIHSIPTGYLYARREFSPNGNPDWVREFEWNGTIDWSAFLAITEALDYRERIGGERRINQYCHQLAIDGGELVAKILGTETMRNKKDDDGELVANMINVRLPIELTDDKAETVKVTTFLMSTQIQDGKTVAPCFPHGGALWTRLSAQIFLDKDDFEQVGHILADLCKRVKAGEHRK